MYIHANSSPVSYGTSLRCCHIPPSTNTTRHCRWVCDRTADALLHTTITTTSCPPLLCLQTLLKLSATNWMQNGATLAPFCMWITIPLRSLDQITVFQATVCWTCWASGPPKRKEQGPSLALGRLWWRQWKNQDVQSLQRNWHTSMEWLCQSDSVSLTVSYTADDIVTCTYVRSYCHCVMWR